MKRPTQARRAATREKLRAIGGVSTFCEAAGLSESKNAAVDSLLMESGRSTAPKTSETASFARMLSNEVIRFSVDDLAFLVSLLFNNAEVVTLSIDDLTYLVYFFFISG